MKTGKSLLPLAILLVASALFSFTNADHCSNKNFHDTLTPNRGNVTGHLGRSVISKFGPVTFTTGLENDFYLPKATAGAFSYYTELRTGPSSNLNASRFPLNISVVIDRSASMKGIKMGYAKKAAKNIIDRLRPEDIISIVVYDTDIDTILPPVHITDPQKIKAKIDLISPQGGTNLWGGAEQGYQFVQRNHKIGFISRVLLISDGRANAGLTDSLHIVKKVQRLKDEEGITLSTFGVGLDYNETLMTRMAEHGAGNYYFIDTPDKMTSIFDKELTGLMNIVVRNAELKIALPSGIRVQKSFPLTFQQSGNLVTIKLGDISSGDTRANLFHLIMSRPPGDSLLFSSAITYTDATNELKTITNRNFLKPATGQTQYETYFNRLVIEQEILYQVNENLENAMNLMEKGDKVGALKYLDHNRDYLKANAAYVSNDKNLLRLDSVNVQYSTRYLQAASNGADSVRRLQKSNKAVNYNIRNKKQ